MTPEEGPVSQSEHVPADENGATRTGTVRSSRLLGDENERCPWCGGGGYIHRQLASLEGEPPAYLHYVVCRESDCRASLGLGEWTEAEAIAKWNRRAKGVKSPSDAEVSDGGPLTHDKPAAQSRRSLH